MRYSLINKTHRARADPEGGPRGPDPPPLFYNTKPKTKTKKQKNYKLPLRGHVNKKKLKKSKKTLEVVGGSSVQLEIKKIGKHIYNIILLRFWASIRTSITL